MDCQARPFTLPRRQARALLFRLAVNGLPVPREHLADLLWQDNPPATARRNLTRLLSYLRGQLPQPALLQVSKTAVSLNSDLATSDAVQFTRLCATDDLPAWETAVALYRGPFLAGFTLNDSPEFESWVSQEQRRLERLYLETLRCWFVKGDSERSVIPKIVLALLIADIVGLIVSLMGTLSGIFNAMGWSAVLIYLVLVIGYAYFWLRRDVQPT